MAHTEEDFPYIECNACKIRYGAFSGDAATQCPHCGEGMRVQLFPGDEGYGDHGPATAGNAQMHQAHAHLAATLPVPVVNPGPLTYALAATLLGLGLAHSRAAYPRPLAPRAALVRAMFDAGQAFDDGERGEGG